MSSFGRDRPRTELASCGNCVREAASPDPTHRIPYYRTQMGAKVRFRALLYGLLTLGALTRGRNRGGDVRSDSRDAHAHPHAQVQAGPGTALPAARARPRARARLCGGARLEDRRAPGVRPCFTITGVSGGMISGSINAMMGDTSQSEDSPSTVSAGGMFTVPVQTVP
jgi:hypothetical protein